MSTRVSDIYIAIWYPFRALVETETGRIGRAVVVMIENASKLTLP